MTSRQVAIIVAVAFGILSPILQALGNVGISQSEFSGNGDQTLRAEGYAFSIWSVIYAGLIAFAIWQALPRHRTSELLDRLGWPAAFAIAGTGAWIWAAALDVRWATVVIIVASAGVLTQALIQQRRARPPLTESVLVWWPLGLLAGWLTIASALNILTVLTAEGLLPPSLRFAAGLAGIALVALTTIGVVWASRLIAFAVPVAWGLIAVWVAEKTTKADVATVALGAAVLLATYALWRGLQTSRHA